MNEKFSSIFILILGLALVAGASATSNAEEFYRGKTIHLVTGGNPGGGYDTYTRAVARHIGKYIPGNPIVIVSNMPGAGTLVAANYMYNRAKPDGLSVGQWSSAFVLYQALGDKKVKLDTRKVNWIGAPGKDTPICAIMGFTGLKTLRDVLNSKKPIKVGGVRAGSPTIDMPKILNRTLGTNFKVIAGYKGTAPIRLAMQRREIDGACWTWESMRATARAMLAAKGDDRLIPYLIHARRNDSEVKDLPLIPEVIKGRDNLDTYNAWARPLEFYRPFSLPPGTSRERVSTLRKAFRATMKDPAFLAEANKSKLIIRYVSAGEIEKMVGELLSISPKAKKGLEFLVRRGKKKG